MNRQQVRKQARDKKRSWDMVVSSIHMSVGPESVLSVPLIQQVVKTAHELNLGIVALIGLEALKVQGLQIRTALLVQDITMLEQQLLAAQVNLAKAQDTIAKMNVRYVRRGSRKARVQHPEKRRG